jgi:hypothetical protein
MIERGRSLRERSGIQPDDMVVIVRHGAGGRSVRLVLLKMAVGDGVVMIVGAMEVLRRRCRREGDSCRENGRERARRARPHLLDYSVRPAAAPGRRLFR